jgi:hypothetical protein
MLLASLVTSADDSMNLDSAGHASDQGRDVKGIDEALCDVAMSGSLFEPF